MSKLNLANLVQDELTKEDARRVRGGMGCLCRCFCSCPPHRDIYWILFQMKNFTMDSFEESSPG